MYEKSLILLPNRKVGSNTCHVLRLPLFTAASKTALIKWIYYFRIFNSEIITKYGLGGTGHIEINWIGLPGGATLTCSLAVNPELFFYS